MMQVYVAAPFQCAPEVREIHKRLTDEGMVPTSRWAEMPTSDGGNESIVNMDQTDRQAIINQNDHDVECCEVVLALVRPGLGKEMFAECALARVNDIVIVWVAEDFKSLPLSAWREDSHRFHTVNEAIEELKQWDAEDEECP